MGLSTLRKKRRKCRKCKEKYLSVITITPKKRKEVQFA